MYQLAMDPKFEPLFSTQQTPLHCLQLKVVTEQHSGEKTERPIQARTTGDEWPSNYNEVRFYLFLCQIILMIITVVSRVSANGRSTITPHFQHLPRVKIEVGGPIVVCTRAHTPAFQCCLWSISGLLV